MEIDLRGYHPAEIVFNGIFGEILQQTWKMDEIELTLIHSNGRNRGIYTGICGHKHGLLRTLYSAGVEARPVVSPVDQGYDARLPTDRLYLNPTETEFKFDEKTIGLHLRRGKRINWKFPMSDNATYQELRIHQSGIRADMALQSSISISTAQPELCNSPMNLTKSPAMLFACGPIDE